MDLIDNYISYIRSVRHYSVRTQEIYGGVLRRFVLECDIRSDEELKASLTRDVIRGYMVTLLGDGVAAKVKTVDLHLSVLSGFCRYLVKEKVIVANPVRTVKRPKDARRNPVFYRSDEMIGYFRRTQADVSPENALLVTGDDKVSLDLWRRRRDRLVISILYGAGLRRFELIGLNVGSADFSRGTLTVLGKGNKMREIPLVDALSEEILLYLQTTARILGSGMTADSPLLVTEKGSRLYPMAVERIVKAQLGEAGVSARKFPHALRHTLATELLGDGADISSIKELLGHSSLAATQVYTHTSIEKLKESYLTAHPRAKRGG